MSCGRLEQISRKYSLSLKNSGLNGLMMKKLFVKPRKNMKSWSNCSIPPLKDMIYIILNIIRFYNILISKTQAKINQSFKRLYLPWGLARIHPIRNQVVKSRKWHFKISKSLWKGDPSRRATPGKGKLDLGSLSRNWAHDRRWISKRKSYFNFS